MLSLLRDPRAVALLLAASLTILSNTIISPALPGIEERFRDQPNAGLMTRLLVTAPSLMVAICAPFAGVSADRFGRRRQLLAGVALYALAGSAGLWLPTLNLILASRLVLGVAVAMILTAQTALIGDIFAAPRRGRFMGLQTAATNFGGLVFLALAGWLATWSPVLPFAIYGVALLYLPLMWVALAEPDRRGAAAGAADLAGAGEPGWAATLASASALAMLAFVSFYLIPTQMPYYLAEIGHPEPTASAALLASVTLSGGVVSLAFGWLRPHLGRAGTPATGFAVFAIGFGLLALAQGLGTAIVAGLIIGAATGLIMPTFLNLALEIAPAARRGAASGAITTSIFLGQFLSPFVSQPLVLALGYPRTFALAAGLMAALAVASLLTLRERA